MVFWSRNPLSVLFEVVVRLEPRKAVLGVAVFTVTVPPGYAIVSLEAAVEGHDVLGSDVPALASLGVTTPGSTGGQEAVFQTDARGLVLPTLASPAPPWQN